MTPEVFRKDKYLRASGYNFYVWAVINVLIVWPVWAAIDGRPWPEWLALVYPIALIAVGGFLCVLNDNRVEKMWGPPSATPVVDAASFWKPIFAIGFVLTIVFVARGPAAYIQPVWLLLIGGGYWAWGSFGPPEFRWLGRVLVAAGAVAGLAVRPEAIPAHHGSREALAIWVVFMGVLWVPFGAYVNRRYVAARPPAQELGEVG